MDISEKAWEKYINALGKMEKTANNKLLQFLEAKGLKTVDEKIAFINYAYGIATKYGEGAAAISCEMYDAIAEAAYKKKLIKKFLQPAEPAETATYEEVAKAINGTLKTTESPSLLANCVSRLVKRTGADTTLKNASRDGAQYAWVPHGDTCPFCLTLASQGWVYTKKWQHGQHAEHIHGNCDCSYAVRFDETSGVKGYDPDYYYEIYKNAEGTTSKQKIRSMSKEYRQANRDEILEKKKIYYQEHRESILADKRDAYRKNKNK